VARLAISDAWGRVVFNMGPAGIVNLRAADLAQIVHRPALGISGQGPGNKKVSQTARERLQQFPDKATFTYLTISPIEGSERVYA
jgi:hypothetical protein